MSTWEQLNDVIISFQWINESVVILKINLNYLLQHLRMKRSIEDRILEEKVKKFWFEDTNFLQVFIEMQMASIVL